MNDAIKAELQRSAETISKIDPAQVRRAADALIEAFRNGNQAIFMGNGGSSADAQHIAAEFSGRYMLERPALPGVCLSNIAPVTAIGNDYSYDLVFKRQVEAICRKGDVVIGMSTSGNSKNVILAMEAAKERGAVTMSFTGDGGKLREIVDIAVIIPSKETPRIQEGYLCACHTMCGIVERELFGQRAVFIDRDDTVAKDVPYCSDPDLFEVYDFVPAAIKRLNDAGFLVIIITNQSGIGRGFFDEETARYGNNTVTANILSLRLGLVPEGYEQRVFENIVNKTEVDFNGHVSTGVLGIQHLMRGLTEYGRVDLAYKILTNETYPSWGYMVRQGATTIWELWNGDTADPAMNSGNHVMLLGDLIIWLYEDLAGIKCAPEATGFKKIVMEPVFPEGLDEVSASYDSVYGTIESAWSRKNGRFSWTVTVPGNTSAVVRIPKAFNVSVKEKPGIHSITDAGEYVEVEIGSGKYNFK